MDRRLGFDNPTSIHHFGNAEDPLSHNFSPEKRNLGVVPVEKLERFYDESSENDGDSSTWLLSQDREEEEEAQPHSIFEADMKPEVHIFPESGDHVGTFPYQVKQEAEETDEEDLNDFDSDSDHDTASEEEEEPEADSSHKSESSSTSDESDDDDTRPWPRPCPQPNCKLTFTTKLLLEAHLTLHGEWQCEKCPLVKDFAPHLALHELQHAVKTQTSKKQKTFQCPRCPPGEKRWDSKIDYIQHFLKTHLSFGKQKKKYVCNICGARMDLVNKNRHHLRHHNTEGLSPSQINQCPQCPAHFNNERYLRSHQYRIHYQTKCPTCSKTLRRTYFWHHMKRCQRKASGLQKLKQSKLYSCDICQKKFRNKNSIYCHKKTFHNGANEVQKTTTKTDFKIEVEECRPIFTDEEHRKTAPIPTETYPCDSCDKSFVSSGHLDRHCKAVHLGLRPFPCDICGRAFSLAQNLRRHQMIHSGERPYKCNTCQKKFRLIQHLKDHWKRTHWKKNGNGSKGEAD